MMHPLLPSCSGEPTAAGVCSTEDSHSVTLALTVEAGTNAIQRRQKQAVCFLFDHAANRSNTAQPNPHPPGRVISLIPCLFPAVLCSWQTATKSKSNGHPSPGKVSTVIASTCKLKWHHGRSDQTEPPRLSCLGTYLKCQQPAWIAPTKLTRLTKFGSPAVSLIRLSYSQASSARTIRHQSPHLAHAIYGPPPHQPWPTPSNCLAHPLDLDMDQDLSVRVLVQGAAGLASTVISLVTPSTDWSPPALA